MAQINVGAMAPPQFSQSLDKSSMKFYLLIFFGIAISQSVFGGEDGVVVIGIKSALEKSGDIKRAIPEFKESEDGDCKFYKSYQFYDHRDASDAASRSFYEGNYYFYGLANGIGPEVPGKEIELLNCLIEIDLYLMWIGADSSVCKKQKTLDKVSRKYAYKFNQRMSELLKSGAVCERI